MNGLDDEKMLGVQLLANGLVNLELLARAWGKKDEPTSAPVEDPNGG